MLSLVLCLVFVILTVEASEPATEIPVIHLRYSSDTNEGHIAWKDKPLKIYIENAYAQYIWCEDAVKTVQPERFVPETEFNTDTVNILKIPQVTTEMNTTWACTLLNEVLGPHGRAKTQYNHRNYTFKILNFHLHVKGARQVIVTANNYKHDLPYNAATKFQNYASANYTYVDGEDVELSCKKNNDETRPKDRLRLEYFNAEGILLFRTESRIQTYTFRSVLNSNNNKYYLECICTSMNTERENRYRINFFMKKDKEKPAITVFVNGQKLTPIFNMDTSVDDYVFKYIDGERINIKCCKTDYSTRGTLYFDFDQNIKHRTGFEEPNNMYISVKIVASNILNNKAVICGTQNTDSKTPNASILFSSDIPNHAVRVRGLPRNNILYQYTNDLNQWIIEYQYSVNDTLHLTCLSRSPGITMVPYNNIRSSRYFVWHLKDGKFFDVENSLDTLPNIKFSEKKTQILNTAYNGTKIKCVYPQGEPNELINKTVEIIFRLKPDNSEAIIIRENDEVNSDIKDPAVRDPYRMMVPISVCFGVFVAIVTMICLICWRKRTKRTHLIENAYDTLSNQNDSPIPKYPSQWEANQDDAQYTDIDEEVMQENYNYSTDNELYRMPFKIESNNSENHYAEIDDNFKLRPDGQTTNWNKAQPSKFNKDTKTASNHLTDAIYNNVIDSKQIIHDKLMHNNLSVSKNNDNFKKLPNKNKSKSVTFRQMSADLKRERNVSEGNSRQCRNNDQRVKQNNDGHYANTDTDIYMQPGDMQKKSDYENNLTQNKKTVNPLDSNYAEPYSEFGVSCKNDLYG